MDNIKCDCLDFFLEDSLITDFSLPLSGCFAVFEQGVNCLPSYALALQGLEQSHKIQNKSTRSFFKKISWFFLVKAFNWFTVRSGNELVNTFHCTVGITWYAANLLCCGLCRIFYCLFLFFRTGYIVFFLTQGFAR